MIAEPWHRHRSLTWCPVDCGGGGDHAVDRKVRLSVLLHACFDELHRTGDTSAVFVSLPLTGA